MYAGFAPSRVRSSTNVITETLRPAGTMHLYFRRSLSGVIRQTKARWKQRENKGLTVDATVDKCYSDKRFK